MTRRPDISKLFDRWFGDEPHNGTAALGMAIMSPEEVVYAVVRFANGELAPDLEKYPRLLTDEWTLARAILRAASEGGQALEDLLARDPRAETVGDISTTPTLQRDPKGRLRFHWRVTGPPDATPWLMLAGVMLQRPDAPEIGLCKLERCSRFFFVRRGANGRPQTKYCCEDHRLEQHALGAGDRQRNARKARKERENQKHKARRSR